jgi:uncharacterized membrane protein (UPF0127 family)
MDAMRWLASIAVALGLMACGRSGSEPNDPSSRVMFHGSDAVLSVEVADTPAERRHGLMGVEELAADEGMVFVFREPVTSGFWMKDTVIPLSIAFVGVDDRIVGVREMEPCRADPCPSYGVERPYVLAIEANAGWFGEHGIGAGDRVTFGVTAYR